MYKNNFVCLCATQLCNLLPQVVCKGQKHEKGSKGLDTFTEEKSVSYY